MRAIVRVILLLTAGALPLALFAQIGSFTISDGSVTYGATGLIGNRITAGGGAEAQYIVGGPNHLFQEWWWYRSPGDTREYALSNQVFGAITSPQSVFLRYLEPIGDGGVPDALLFELEYTVTDLAPGSEKPDWGILQIAWKVRNLTASPVEVNLFSYTDFDLNRDSGDDTAFITGTINNEQIISDIPQGTQNPTTALYNASGTALTAWEIGPFPAVRTKLANTTIDNLANTVSPFGPGDYTGAFQWTFPLNPAGQQGDQLIGSVVKQVVVVPEPGTLLALGSGLALLALRRRKA